MANKRLSLLVLSLVLSTACSQPKTSERYTLEHDKSPLNTAVPELTHLEALTPWNEPLSKQGNRNYTVRGKSYEVWQNIDNYNERGKASWYGEKFHGFLTSNGEIYDMYSLSAAHKHLPLPSFVEVTNLANGRKTIVRVNDRGPFHEERIIDLSYAAAYQLGMLDQGVGEVALRLIHFDKASSAIDDAFMQQHEYFIQLMASRNATSLAPYQQKLSSNGLPVSVLDDNSGWQKLRLGPYRDHPKAKQALENLTDFPNAYIIEQQINP